MTASKLSYIKIFCLLISSFIQCEVFNLKQSEDYCSNDICHNSIFKWHVSKINTLYIGGIFPMVGSWPGGQSNLPSSIMALNEINSNTEILPNYRLNLTWFNSECNPGKGISNLYDLLYRKNGRSNDIIMILGPGCSDVSSSVAEAAKEWNLTVLSFGSSSPALSNRERFKTFYRTHPSAILNNPARLALCKKYKWKKISTLQDTLEVFSSTIQNLEKEAKSFDIEVITRQTFNTDPTDAVKNLKKQDARIIVGVFYEDKARKVFCRAYRENMLFPKYIWMIIGWYSENWYLDGDEKEIGCNKTEMKIAVYGHFTTEIQMFSDDLVKKMDSGYSANDFNDKFNNFVSDSAWKDYTIKLPKVDYKNRENTEPHETLYQIYEDIYGSKSPKIEKLGGYLERALGYDAVWAMGYALHKTLKKFQDLNNFNLNNYTINEYVKNSMDQTNFNGISGHVWFNRDGDRISKIIIEQLQLSNKTSSGLEYRKLGTHLINNLACCENVVWGNMNSKPPVDGVQYIMKVKRISSKLSKFINIIASISILITLGCLIFNIIFRFHRIIKFSMSNINSVMLIGCLICFISVILFGLSVENMTINVFNLVCQIKFWTLSIGFSVAYGALFTKIWYVYNQSLNKNAFNKEKDIVPIQAVKLYSLINLFVIIDILILLIWKIRDPLIKYRIQLYEEISEANPDVVYRYHSENCNCKNYLSWIGILYGYKGLVLLLGVFFSYESRGTKIEKVVNDSKFVMLSIYNIAILALITVLIVSLIQYEQDASYVFMTSSIIVSCLISILLIFLPKLVYVVKNSGADEKLTENTCMNELNYDDKYKRLLNQCSTLSKLIEERQTLLKEINLKTDLDQNQGTSSNDLIENAKE